MELFAYSWSSDPVRTVIRIFGIGVNSDETYCLRVDNFFPYVYLEIPVPFDQEVLSVISRTIMFFLIEKPLLVFKPHLYNYLNIKENTAFFRCRCNDRKSIFDLIRLGTKGILVPGKGHIYFKIHEFEASTVLQLVSRRDLPMSGWISFSNFEEVFKNDKETSCHREFKVKWENLRKGDNKTQVNPKILAIDLEVNSSIISSMPSNQPDDKIFQASVVIKHKDVLRKILFTLAPNDEKKFKQSPLMKEIEAFIFNSEVDLLRSLIKFIADEKPNVITGFNILNFDFDYLLKRCERYFLVHDLKEMGWNKTDPASIEKIKWSSSAYKNQEFNFINWEGILLLDLLPIIQRDVKLDTYTLQNIASKYLKETKDPVSFKDIFLAYRSRDKMDVIGHYCVNDSLLCIKLMDYFHSWIDLSQMAKVCNVSMFTLYTQGQQIKTYSQVYKYCQENNIVVSSNSSETKISERYMGAYVIEPTPGYYERVVPFDFKSLYPSIIIAYNICYSTICKDTVPSDECNVFEWKEHFGCEHDPKVIEIDSLNERISAIENEIKELMKQRDSVKTSTVDAFTKVKDRKKEIQEKINQKRNSMKPFIIKRKELKTSLVKDKQDIEGNIILGKICEIRKYVFYKPEIKKGVVPTIIQNLLDSRASIREQMKNCSGLDRIVYDKEQIAYKISANSMYGGMGVRRGYLPFMPGAMCVTYLGRKAIKKTEQHITQMGGTVIYGDTDSIYTVFKEKRSPKEIWDFAVEVAKSVSTLFPPPMELNFEEKIFSRFLIFTKKKYIYQSVDQNGKILDEIGTRGVTIARRDNSNLLRRIYEDTAKLILQCDPNRIAESKNEIIDGIINYISNIFRNVLPLEDFVITKSVGSFEGTLVNGQLGDYKVKKCPKTEEEKLEAFKNQTERDFYIAQLPGQVKLAEKMRKRGIPINAGSRLEYVVVDKPDPLIGSRMEDYNYVKSRKEYIKLDFLYYLDTLITPLDQLLSVSLKEKDLVKQQYRIRSTHKKLINEFRLLTKRKPNFI